MDTSSATADTKVLKQYDILNENLTSGSKLTLSQSPKWTLSQNGQPVFRTECRTKWKGIYLHLMSADGTTTLATVKPKSTLGKAMFISLGDPDQEESKLAGHPTLELKCETLSQSKYSFTHLSRPYTWTRTHNKDIGGHKWGNMDYKLVDQVSGEVLAVWSNLNEATWAKRNPEGRILFFTEMERELEMLSLAAICRIEVFQRQQTTAAVLST